MLKNFLRSSRSLYHSRRFFSELTGSDQSVSKYYDPGRHTLLPDIFTYRFNKDYLGYIIYERATSSLISVDPGDFEVASKNIELLELEFNAKLRYVLSTHHHEGHNGAASKLKTRFKDIDVVIGNYGTVKGYNTKAIEEIKHFEVGNLSICLFHTPGHTDDSCTFIFHHVTPESTKTPIAFTGDTLYIGSCGNIISKDYAAMYNSLNKLKNLPNETLIFPSHDNAIHNLTWIKTIDPKNPFLKMRLLSFEKAIKEKQFCIPSLIMEEKKYNPFLRCHEKYFVDLMEEKEPVKVFTKLKKTQEIMFKI